MGVASCRSTFLCLMLRVRLVPFRISIRDLIPFSGRARRWFRSAKWPGPTWPNPARPGPARPCAPLAPTPPHAPLLSLSHLDLPRNNLPLPPPPLSPWCPRNWRRRSPEFGPRGELPSPPLLLSLSPSLSSSSSPACAIPFPCSRATPPAPCPQRRAPPPLPCSPAVPPAPSPGPRRAAPPRLLLAGARRPPARPPARGGARPPPPARPARPPARPRLLRASFWPLAWFAWPRASPFTASAFPRARPAFAVIIFGW
jgi:hypothetical protein